VIATPFLLLRPVGNDSENSPAFLFTCKEFIIYTGCIQWARAFLAGFNQPLWSHLLMVYFYARSIDKHSMLLRECGATIEPCLIETRQPF
jgi:hypothetical protein